MTTWKILKIYNRGSKGVFAHLYNTDPENSDTPNTLCQWVPVSEFPQYGLKWDGPTVSDLLAQEKVTYHILGKKYETLKLF